MATYGHPNGSNGRRERRLAGSTSLPGKLFLTGRAEALEHEPWLVADGIGQPLDQRRHAPVLTAGAWQASRNICWLSIGGMLADAPQTYW